MEPRDPEDDAEPILCLAVSAGGLAAEGCRYVLSIVWPRGRTEEGFGVGLEELLSKELGK